MAEQEKTKVIVLEPVTKLVEELLKVIVQKGQAEVERVSSSAEVAQLAAQYQPCMLMACIVENGQVPDRVNMLKRMETSLKKGLVKTMIASSLKNAQLGNVITALGVTDFIQEPVPLRTMQFKANLQLKAVETIRKAEQRRLAGEEKMVFKKSDAAGKDGAAGSTNANAKAKPALQLKEDAFLFKNNGVKKVGKKFVLEMEGPAPETGEWKQHEDKGNAQTSWRWVPKEDENGNPLSDKGDGWVHEGDKPEFKEATGKWQLASEKPQLAYRQNGTKVAEKVSTDDNGEVSVAADSPAAAEAVERTRAIAKAKREKNRGKPEAVRTDPAKKEKAEGEAAPAEAAAEEEKKKDNPALAMLKRLKQQTDKPVREGEVPAEEAAAEAAAPAPAEAEEEGREEFKKNAREKKKGLSPLDFLKQKMEKGAKAGEEPEAAAESAPAAEEDSAEAPELARAKREKSRRENDAPEESAEPAPEKDSGSARKSLDALARLKGRLGAGSESAAEEITEETNEDSAAPAAESAEAEEESAAGEAIEKNSREKKDAVAKAARLKAVKDRLGEEGAAPAAEEEEPLTRREVLAEIQERINSPLPEEMAPEEEARLRKKFGLEDRPEVKTKDLARKERLDAIKKLKDLLEKNTGDPSFEETAPPEPTLHDLSDDSTSSLSQSGALGDRRESLLRAFDSEDKPLDEDDSPAALAKKRRQEAKDRPDLYADESNYLPVAAVTPLGQAWEAAGEHYAYLASEVRYHGFDKLEDLLPLWIFAGDKKPELLDKTQQWRFYGPVAVAAKTLAEVPRPVRDFLLGLRDQLRKEEELSPAAVEERAAVAAINAAEDARAEVSPEEREKERPATQAAGLEEIFEKKKKEGPSAAQAALDALKNRLGGDDSAANDELSATVEGREGTDLELSLNEETRKKSRAAENEEAPEETESGGDRKANEAQARLDSLKNRLGGDDSPESSEAKADASEAEESDSPAAEAARKNDGPAESLTEQTLEKLKASSPSMEKFLERRKAKMEAALAGESAGGPAAGKAAAAASRTPGYLGIYVAISNSFGGGVPWEKAVGRVLKATQISFGACEVALIRQAAPDAEGYYLVDQVSGSEMTAGARVHFEAGFAAPVAPAEAGRAGEILGYLFLLPTSGREKFTAGEEEAARKAASLLWPVMKSVSEEEESAKGKAA